MALSTKVKRKRHEPLGMNKRKDLNYSTVRYACNQVKIMQRLSQLYLPIHFLAFAISIQEVFTAT